MPAFIIADVKIKDPEKYKGYTALTPNAVSAAGGAFVVRGGRTHVFEGDWIPGRIVLIQFETFEAAQSFYDSALYQEARSKREGATESFNMIVVEGIA